MASVGTGRILNPRIERELTDFLLDLIKGVGDDERKQGSKDNAQVSTWENGPWYHLIRWRKFRRHRFGVSKEFSFGCLKCETFGFWICVSVAQRNVCFHVTRESQNQQN